MNILLLATLLSSQDFPVKLYQEILKDHSGENVFISPISIHMVLSMSCNGAEGATAAEMKKALQLDPQWNRTNYTLLKNLKDLDPQVNLELAHSIWVRSGFPVKKSFLEEVQKHYDALVESIDFSSPDAALRINNWVHQHTRGKIQEIVKAPLPPEAMLYLINAVYFHGDWANGFDPKHTQPMPFHGRPHDVPMMKQTGRFRYFETQSFKAARLPYGKNNRCALYVFVPQDLGIFTSKLAAAAFEEWLRGFRETEVEILLPRFRCEFKADLSGSLERLGMRRAFLPDAADFSALSPERIRISKVIHKSFVDVNEKGTEAAAVTGVEMGPTSFRPRPRLIADRPFFAALRDDLTGTLLFMGSILKP